MLKIISYFHPELEPFENGVRVKFLPALIATVKRIFMSINHIPNSNRPNYLMDIVLGMDSCGGFPQMQGKDTLIPTDHMTPGMTTDIFF